VADVVSFGSDKPPWHPSRRLIAVAVVTLSAVVIGVAVLASRDPAAPRAVAPPAVSPAPEAAPVAPCRPMPASSPAGLVIDEGGQASALVRCDRGAAAEGPWTVVVRRRDGSLARRGAVVTFPVGPPDAGRTVDVGGAAGTAGAGTIVWPVAGRYARIRGDLPEPALIAIAARTTVTGDRPRVDPPTGYRVVSAGSYRPPAVHENRYGSDDLGEQDALGAGLTYASVFTGGGFEDQLYAVRARDGGLVAGRPAVVSAVFGGNGTIAWELTPGVVALIGYSGSPMDDTAVAALQGVAERARAVTGREWQALAPQTVDQTNEPG
jgi:hypothetical protein